MARAIRGPNAKATGVFRALERTGLRKGIEGSRPWFYVGTGLLTLRMVRRLAGDKEEILISERLKPGQRIVIANGVSTSGEPLPLARSSRRARRSARKVAKRAPAADA